MEVKTTTVVLMAVLAIGSGIGGFALANNADVNAITQSTSYIVKPVISGHLTIEALDSEGNVKAYRESDNIITQMGEDCALRALFNPAGIASNSGTTTCTGALTKPWTYIAVGTGGTQEVGTQQTLTTESASLGLTRAPATTVTWTNATGGSETGVSSQIVLAKTFSVSGGSATITEAGLFNDTQGTTDSMFARKTFSGVSVSDGDSLTVTWTINVGNTTSLN